MIGENYVEHLAAVDNGSCQKSDNIEQFTTMNMQCFDSTGKTGNDLMEASKRQDIALKYIKYGNQKVLRCGSDPDQHRFSSPLHGTTQVLLQERSRRLENEASYNIYLTVQRDELQRAAAASPDIRNQAKQSACRPKADAGQE